MKKCAICTVLMLLFAFGSVLMGQSNLPGLAVSLSEQSFQEELQQVSNTQGGVVELFFPALEIYPGTPLDMGIYSRIFSTLQSLSTPVERLWLRLKILPPNTEKTAAQIEQDVANLVNQVVQNSGFKYTGILLEADPGTPLDLVRLVVVSFSVALKSGSEEKQLAVFASLARTGGEKVAAYADRLILSSIQNWQEVRPQWNQMSIGRPFSLLLSSPHPQDCRREFLDALLEFPAKGPDCLILENLRQGCLEPLLTLIASLDKRLPVYLEKTDGTLPFFKLKTSGETALPQITFTDATMNRAVVLARVADEAGVSLSYSFVPPAGESFKLACYEPLDALQAKPITPSGTNITWNKRYLLVTAEKQQAASEVVGESVTVSARVELSLDEIVARWQRYDARQKKEIKNYMANTEMDMHFEPPNLGAGFDVSLHFRYFWDQQGTQYWEQTSQYLNGIKLPGKRSFPLPQLEPEQVVTQPLELNLVENYAYSLESPETVDGVSCYVLSFRPRSGVKGSLYSGKIWIDTTTFRKVRFWLVQENCAGSILSNSELQHYEVLPGPNGQGLNLLVRSEVEQKVLAAGREFLLERRYRFNDIVINAGDFDERLQTAVRGKLPMFTETKQGLREYVLAKDGSRMVKDRVTSFIWSLVTGMLYDDTASFPIPFVGVSAIEYNFLKTKAQLSTLLMVPFLAMNLTKQYQGNLTLGADLALSAIPRNDQVYQSDTKIKGQALYVFSGSIGLRARWQAFKDLAFTWSNYLITEIFTAQKETDETFRVPRDGFSYNTNLDLEYSRKGYTATLSGSYFNRFGWQQWGYAGDSPSSPRSYAKYYATLGKRFYLGSFTRLGIDLSYYGGYHLDRFSSYQPSLLAAPKIRGVSGGAISLDSLGVASLNLGFTAFDVVRFDAYYNFARGREYLGASQNFQGLELDFGTVGPWGSYMQGRISYALAGPTERYQSRWGAYLMMFFPFKK